MKPKRFVYAFVADIRNIPRDVDLRHRSLRARGVQIQVFDMVHHSRMAKRYKVAATPYYLVMQFDAGTLRIHAETRYLHQLEEWVGWML